MKKTLIIAISLIILSLSAWAGSLHKLHWTDTSFTVHEDLTVSPACETSANLGSTTNLLTNDHTCLSGVCYSINYQNDSLYADGQLVHQLYTLSFGSYQTLDIPNHFGFCFDKAGVGWLVTAWRDGDPNKYLWRMNANTGECVYVDVVDFGDPSWVTGMYMVEP